MVLSMMYTHPFAMSYHHPAQAKLPVLGPWDSNCVLPDHFRVMTGSMKLQLEVVLQICSNCGDIVDAMSIIMALHVTLTTVPGAGWYKNDQL